MYKMFNIFCLMTELQSELKEHIINGIKRVIHKVKRYLMNFVQLEKLKGNRFIYFEDKDIPIIQNLENEHE